MAALLKALNAARAQTRACNHVSLPAVGPLAWHTALAAAADRHAIDMAENNFHDHSGSDGSYFDQRITAAGCGWTRAGENIAAGYSTVNDVVQAWLKNPGHCEIIMDENFQHLGGSCRTSPSSDDGTYWTTTFGKPR